MSEAQAADRAAFVICVAVAVHNKQWRKLATMGLSETQARRLINKRHRGRVGELIGDLSDLFPKINKTAGAVRLVLEHGMSIARAAKFVKGGTDRSNVSRAVRSAARAIRGKAP